MLVSGSRASALVLPGSTQLITWPDIATDDHCALSLRCDRLLIVGGKSLKPGWHSENQLASSGMSAAYNVFQLTGPSAIEQIKRGTELDTELPSGSVSRLFHGYPVHLYRWRNSEGIRLHVETSQTDGLYALLTSIATDKPC